ncbi:hypothetical protein M758_UG205000 [Ceratodon purpureus]|nr:hypothetical protein M758_UG205000 [Ceratodon purpureus]
MSGSRDLVLRRAAAGTWCCKERWWGVDAKAGNFCNRVRHLFLTASAEFPPSSSSRCSDKFPRASQQVRNLFPTQPHLHIWPLFILIRLVVYRFVKLTWSVKRLWCCARQLRGTRVCRR